MAKKAAKKTTKKTTKKATKKTSKKVAKTATKMKIKSNTKTKAITKKAKKTTKKTVKKTTGKVTNKTANRTTNKTTNKVAPKKMEKMDKLEKQSGENSKMPTPVLSPGISLGSMVPDFSLPSSSGSEFVLSGLKGKKVVLFFYPKDATPGCTLEGHDFSRLLSEFHNLNAEVFGISRDSIKSHCQFRDKEGYSVQLLSDSEELACHIFGVIKEKNMYGKMVLGIERSTFLIDENGKLIKEWRKVKVEGHAQEVLDSLKA